MALANVFRFPPKEGVATGDGEFPSFTADYEIDLLKMVLQREAPVRGDLDAASTGTKSDVEIMKRALDRIKVDVSKIKSEALKNAFMERFLEGEWEFSAKVKPHEQEVFDEEWHVSRPPARVTVQNKKMRILLFAGGPTRDYQFVRTLLAREAQAEPHRAVGLPADGANKTSTASIRTCRPSGS